MATSDGSTRGKGGSRARGRGRPSRRDLLRRAADEEVGAIADAMELVSVPAPAPAPAPAADPVMSAAEIGRRLTIPEGIECDALRPSLRIVPAHPLGSAVVGYASLASQPLVIAQDEYKRVHDFCSSFWRPNLKAFSSTALEVRAQLYGMQPKSVRRTERRLSAAAELVERQRCVDVQAQL